MKKIGLISLALVLALGALGAAYAPWTDQVEIIQVVHTGSLEIGVRGEAELVGQTKEVASVDVTHGEPKFVKDEQQYHDSVTVTVDNLYPCVYVEEDFYIGVGGTIPVHLHSTFTVDDPEGLFNHMTFEWTLTCGDGYVISGEGLYHLLLSMEGEQVHPCETVHIRLVKHMNQSAPQGATASFTIEVVGYQYNYDPPVDPQEPPEGSKQTAWSDGPEYNRGWGMYTIYEADKTVDLIAGQHYPAGTVTFSAVDVNGYVTITIALYDGWEFWDEAGNVAIDVYETSDDIPPHPPAPGSMDYQYQATSSPFTAVVPEGYAYGIHANVVNYGG